MLEGYKNRDAKTEIAVEKQKGESISGSSLWSELEDRSVTDQGVDKFWPCEAQEAEAESYPYPYELAPADQDSADWLAKEAGVVDETFDDRQNVKYAIANEFKVKIKKLDIEFDPNKVQLFRVSLTPNEQRL